MDFFSPEDTLQRATPEETYITSLTADPYPDGERVRVDIMMTPFQTRPYLDVSLTDANGDEIASTSIVEPISWKLEFTMHLHGANANPFKLAAILFYPNGPHTGPVTHIFNVSQAK